MSLPNICDGCPFKKGLNKKIVAEISERKNEPGWMTDFRLISFELFEHMPMPKWGVDLSGLDPNDISYYIKPTKGLYNSWADVPDKIKKTFVIKNINSKQSRINLN